MNPLQVGIIKTGSTTTLKPLALVVENWSAGPNYGRPHFQKYWVFLAQTKCNELGKECSTIGMNLQKP